MTISHLRFGKTPIKSTYCIDAAGFIACHKDSYVNIYKDMGGMAITYGYVYVANVAMGASKQQLIKAFTEAESYDGPSLIMAYAPCINHGIKKGMGKTQEEEKLAVKSGYWPLYQYNPALKAEGKNPFIFDSKAPDGSLQEFLSGEVRYAALKKAFPEESKKQRARIEEEFNQRYEGLRMLAGEEIPSEEEAEEEKPSKPAKIAEKKPEEIEACTLSGTAKHSRPDAPDESCDDGRSGKI